jgi:predicted heme/steroid binding protein
MTREELARYNGKNGQPACVAVRGTVYDVSQSAMWQAGWHADSHQAGCDLTLELKTAPHVAAVIERFPVVGRLEESPAPGRKSLIFPLVLIVVVVLVAGWLLLR